MTAREERGLLLTEPNSFEVQVGAGISAKVDGHDVVIGNAAQMIHAGNDPQPLFEASEAKRRDGAGIMFIAVDGVLGGLLP